MSGLLDASVITGPVRWGLLLAGAAALLQLARPRGRRLWWRTVLVAVDVGVAAGLLAKVYVEQVWHPFPDPLPWTVTAAVGVAVTALVLAVVRSGRLRLRSRFVAGLAVLVVAVVGAAQVNQHFRSYPTVRAALGLSLHHEVSRSALLPPSQLPLATDPLHPPRTVSATVDRTLEQQWEPPADMPAHGVVSEVPMPGTVSGFPARSAWVYVPPAYLTAHPPLLPVLVLVSGSPGHPKDWFNGAALADVLDGFAAQHHGLAPVVVSVDPLGSQFAHPLCADTRLGKVFTYLTQDVPAGIKATLKVDGDHARWAVAGYSSGGTCSLQLAVSAPMVYPTFLDISGEKEPTHGSRAGTVRDAFGGDAAAFSRIAPLEALARGARPQVEGFLTVGRDDGRYKPEAQTVLKALTAAGVPVTYAEVPGTHSWASWAPGFRAGLPWVVQRMRLAG